MVILMISSLVVMSLKGQSDTNSHKFIFVLNSQFILRYYFKTFYRFLVYFYNGILVIHFQILCFGPNVNRLYCNMW